MKHSQRGHFNTEQTVQGGMKASKKEMRGNTLKREFTGVTFCGTREDSNDQLSEQKGLFQ